jgi:hypothetical protein
MKTLIILSFLIPFFLGTASGQNYLPTNSINSICVKTSYEMSGPQGFYHSFTYFDNNYEITDTIINQIKFFNFKFAGNISLHYNQDEQKVYTYVSSSNSIQIAADFNLEVNDTSTFFFFKEPRLFKCTKKDTVFFWNQFRRRIEFKAVNSVIDRAFSFMEGVGVYWKYTWDYSAITESHDSYIFSAIIDSVKYNPSIVQINSVPIINSRPINTFPFVYILNCYMNYNFFIDSFYIDMNVYREDSMVNNVKFNFESISSDLFYTNIVLDTSQIMVGDVIEYRIVYKDKSIFWNSILAPDTGFLSFSVLPPITEINENQTETVQDYFLYDAYPNPFNSSTNIQYSIPQNEHVKLKVFDIIGNEIAVLVDEIKEKGLHAAEFKRENLSSGIYIIRFQANRYHASRKIVFLK